MTVSVCIRLTPDENASPPCITVKDPQTLKIENPGEIDRKFHNVFATSDSDSSAASTIASSVGEALSSGNPAGVLVYGTSNSGKSSFFKEIVTAAGGAATQGGATPIKIVLIHKDIVLDLLNTSADNLKFHLEEAKGELVLEGCAATSITSGSAAWTAVEGALANRDTWCTANKSNPKHSFVLITIGLLVLVECAGCERFDNPMASAEEKAELQQKNDIIRKINMMGSQIGRGDDPRAISWKETKITRCIQAPLATAMESKGFFAFVFCAVDGQSVAPTAVSTLNVAETFVKSETLKTVSEYKELIAAYEERIDDVKKVQKGHVASAAVEENAVKSIQEDYDRMVAELNGKAQAIEQRIIIAKKKMESDKVAVRQEFEKKKIDAAKAMTQEVEKLKQMFANAGSTVDAQIKAKTTEVEAQRVAFDRDSAQKISAAESEFNTLKQQIDQHEEKFKVWEAADRKATATTRPLEKEILQLKQELSTAGVPREQEKTPEELEKLLPIWEVRDKVDDLAVRVRALRIKCLRLENAKAEGLGKPADSDKESDDDSDDSDSDESDSEDEEEKTAKKAEEEKKKFITEQQQFITVSRKEHHLSNLLEQILQYLEYGCCLHKLDCVKFVPQFFFLSKDRSVLHICEMDQNGVPMRKFPSSSHPLTDVVDILLGQHNPSFQNATVLSPHAGSPILRGDTPPEISTLSITSTPFFFYRSFSIVFQNGVSVDVIAESATDYEAWIVALHKLTTLEPHWGKELDIDAMDMYRSLLAQERETCRTCHLPPVMYLKLKELVLCHPKLYITLYDIRTITNIDLFHCQRLFVFFVKQKWIDRYVMYYISNKNKPEKIPQGKQQPGGKRPPAKNALFKGGPGSPAGKPGGKK